MRTASRERVPLSPSRSSLLMVIGSSSGRPESSTTNAVISLVMDAIGTTQSTFLA
jgi:hypothetical protein